jgi:hypothetical protein
VAPALKMVVPLAILLYAISPIDLVPDLLLGLGQIDDFGLLGASLLIALRLLPRIAPQAVLSEHLFDLGLIRPEWAPSPQPHQPRGTVVDAHYRVTDEGNW